MLIGMILQPRINSKRRQTPTKFCRMPTRRLDSISTAQPRVYLKIHSLAAEMLAVLETFLTCFLELVNKVVVDQPLRMETIFALTHARGGQLQQVIRIPNTLRA